jgi:hypothetical protein
VDCDVMFLQSIIFHFLHFCRNRQGESAELNIFGN